VAEFLAAPTWLDNQDLVPGGNAQQQEGSLYNTLLKASGWANQIAEQPLHARSAIAQDRVPVDRWGNAYLVPKARPIRSVDGLAWGWSFQDMQAVTDLPSQVWVEKQETVIFQLNGATNAGLANLQFGRVRPVASEIYCMYAYTVGYCNTTLSVAADEGATEIYLADPTGLQPAVSGGLLGTIPGSVMRIWEPLSSDGTTGGEEAVQVSPNWAAGTNPVQLASPLAHAHAIGAGISEMPPEIHQAIISLTVGLLCREDVTADAPFPGGFGPTVRESKTGGKAGGLVDHAKHVLHRYRPFVH
jgi:hypothetical protein